MTASCYIELRKSAARGTDSTIADAMRHLHTRQHLGKTVIIHTYPAAILSPARKQWLKLTRSLQRQRSSTLNADKILKYTHGITRMQRMRFSAKTPLEQPDGDVYFLAPDELLTMPLSCWTVYVLCELDAKVAENMLLQLPRDALVVDYLQARVWETLELRPKRILETRVTRQWRQVVAFLHSHNIDVSQLAAEELRDIDAMDEALDSLLGGHTHTFLQEASDFQRALELARPLRLTKPQRTAYDALILLGHRVQALTPGAFVHQFLEVYGENDTFFLYDPTHTRKQILGGQTLSEAFRRHSVAGRYNLARAIQALAESG
jgi:hypothetical protein